MMVEDSPPERCGCYGSRPQMGSSAALLIATGLFTLVSRLPEERLPSQGRRVPFLLSTEELGPPDSLGLVA